MSVSAAMKTAVTGLISNSTAVARISENIANSATTGYKRTFATMVTATTPGAGSVSGVRAENGSEVSTGGLISSTGIEQDLAVSGDGFFVVSKNPNETLLSNYFLTRAGSFREDENGYLVNSAGYYLAAYPYNTDTGQLGAIDRNGFNGLSSVKLGAMSLTAQPSTTATVTGNLPAQETGQTPPGEAFLSSMEFYTQLGRNEQLQLSWQPTEDINTWHLSVSDSTGRLHGVVEVTYANSGATPGAPQSYALVNPQPGNAHGIVLDAATGVMSLEIDAAGDTLPLEVGLGTPGSYTGIQQFVGDFTPQKFNVDGSGQTSLARTETDSQGVIWGVFDDGRRTPIYEVPLAQVTNPNGLTLIDGNAWQTSRAAGSLTLTKAGTAKNGTVVSGALEGSTVEVATELTDLIRVQRAYSSNAKIVSTADEMLQEINNLKR